ncbi:MAG: MltA domain-containing protein [Desulfarculus sp.]|nr:MltA domain-containing protein [Desulfarculus sp.]
MIPPLTACWRLDRWALPAVLLLLAACAAPTPPTPLPSESPAGALVEVPLEEWPLLLDDLDAASLVEACNQSLTYLRRVPPDRMFNYGPHQRSAASVAAGLERLRDVLVRTPDPTQRRQVLQREFILLAARGSDGQGRMLMTGYYEPVLPGRRQPQPPYVHPLYALPDDALEFSLRQLCESHADMLKVDCSTLPSKRLVGRVENHKLARYHDRDAIDFHDALRGKAQPLAYVDDLVEQFFLHIQGSGQVIFADGRRIRLGYAGSNGHPYRAIGQELLDRGLLAKHQMSMQNIKKVLAERPDLRREVLAKNPSYVFFRELPASGGPPGALGVPITAGRSIAVDRSLFPDAGPAFIVGARPAPGGQAVDFSRFVLAQDSGGAIKGPGRLDLFFGSGSQAGELAGRMKHEGRLYFLAPRR